jgi:hypothetical protein
MANILPSYLADLASAFADKSADRIASLVPLHPAHQAYRPLQSALNSVSLRLGYLNIILTLQLPESSLSTREVSESARRLPQDVKDNFASFVVALLKFVRLPDREDLEGMYAKFTALISAYTYVNLSFAECGS